MSYTVADIRTILDRAYPPYLAESWDKVGLICGDPAAPVRSVGFALDVTLEVAQRAVEQGVDMLIVHHPLLLRGVNSVAADTPKGQVLHTLIRGGVALFAAHTNADSARPGVNDKLAELVGIRPGRPIKPIDPAGLDKWGVQVPESHLEQVKQALFSAGAGEIGHYAKCAYSFPGTGQFEPQDGADPYDGEVGTLQRTAEWRVECVAPRRVRQAIHDALQQAHPYEEVAFDIVELAGITDPEQAYGLGRIGQLPEPMRLADFVQQVANALPETAWGIRAAGDPEQLVQRVAVSSGAGDSFLDTVRGLDVDVYVTSDLRHHPVDEYLRAGGPAVIDTAHWASEFPWTAQVSELIATETGLDTTIIDIRTDPWTMSAHPHHH
ncbi:Nif3-like dinuclear metal center hexameric protein [Corynebacterium sp. TAE3-ERU2]|uniref:Nif3-like dinuclear metal center hexameric protein n=1 Tax=Corynebacterium sp. TAE3-ERU2 TaxID=2849497 RepID=UPI001C490732|nr:Nif3-like dinuclear metal center hexameric protein [Corynebacterium sp. TAE3-ERU2]MBV7301373.1 Nif3-like dinuclear metal center hexameric protein [Corynebacterium sp. TAE3-ERU2]